MHNIHTLLIGDKLTTESELSIFNKWIARHPRFCSKITCLDTYILTSTIEKFNLKKLIVRTSEYEENDTDVIIDMKVDLLILYADCYNMSPYIRANTQIFICDEDTAEYHVRYVIFKNDVEARDNEHKIYDLLADMIYDGHMEYMAGGIVSVIKYVDMDISHLYIDQPEQFSILTEEELHMIDMSIQYCFTLELVRVKSGTHFEGTDLDLIHNCM